MSHQGAHSMTKLFMQVLEGCDSRDSSMISGALRTLMHDGTRSWHSPEYMRLYQVCLLYLKLNRIEEIRSTFNRLSEAWKTALLSVSGRYRTERRSDVEIEPTAGKMLAIRTVDAAAARQLRSIRSVRTDMIERLPSGETLWSFMAPRSGMRRILERLRRPQYLEFLDKNESRQLSLEI